MPLKLFRHHNAAQIGVLLEANAEQVEDFTLVIVGSGPHWGDGLDGGAGFVEKNAQPDALFQRVRQNVIAQLKSRRGGEPVDGGHIVKEVIAGGEYCSVGGGDFLAFFGGCPSSQFVSSYGPRLRKG